MALIESDTRVSLKGKKDGEEITILEVSFAFDESVPEEAIQLITQEMSIAVMELLNG